MDNKKHLVGQWIKKAEHDLGMAELALNSKAEYTDSICYHCQQVAEKYLKAYLVYLNMPFKKRHNLVYLLDLIDEKDKIADNIYSSIEKLEDYAVEIRYPGDTEFPSVEDAKEARNIAVNIKKLILSKIKSV